MKRKLLLGYLALLGAAHLTWALRDAPPAVPAQLSVARLAAVEDGRRTGGAVRLAYADLPAGAAGAPTLLLLHGSPGSRRDFDQLLPHWRGRYRLLVPDLPGFGASRQPLPDYSAAAHADYLLQLLDHLQIAEAQVVAFSMGGAAAVQLADRAPERVASISLVAAIGVQELELFGGYRFNHFVHGLQLKLIQAARWLLPHFGALDRAMLGLPYARNFYDTDQRPLRGMLQRYGGPLCIVHGRKDFLVTPRVAEEHHRIVPQSEIHWLDRGHFLLWQTPERVAAVLGDFVERVASGAEIGRDAADPSRLAAAALPFDQRSVPPLGGFALALAMLLIAAATLVSEDLACIATGLLVAQGRLAFWPGTLACFLGIFFGDLLLYFAGRFLGRPALHRAPLRWWLKPEGVARASAWFQRRGWLAIFLSRFIPGFRLTTYFAAGLLHTRFLVFAGCFLLAGAIWTPLLVGFASSAGLGLRGTLQRFERLAVPAFIILILLLFLITRLLIPALTWRGRRELVGSWRRKLRWEFWPPYVFYVPVLLHYLWLALKHRSLSLVTAVNPGIPHGGFIGESKSQLLDALGGDPRFVARYHLLPAAQPPEQRLEIARRFLDRHQLDFPAVYKPDVGQRGAGVWIVRSAAELQRLIGETTVDYLIQEYAAGVEFGVFYYRYPHEQRGRIFSITEKRMPTVTGDGASTLEELILKDARAVCAAESYRRANSERLDLVPARGEEVQLVELGTHCRGAAFFDGAWLNSPELEEAIDRLSRGFDGFYFGRYDIRTSSVEGMRRGEVFKVVELNGLTSEATHIYDPRYGVLYGWRILFRQWRIAFEIARQNRGRGARPSGVWRTLKEVLAYRRLRRGHA